MLLLRNVKTLLGTIVIIFLLLVSFIAISRNRTDWTVQTRSPNHILAEALERLHAEALVQMKISNAQKFSIHNVPKFCRSLKPPLETLPLLTPSVTGYKLNEMGKKKSLAQDDERIINYLWDHCDIFLRPPNGKPSNFYGRNPSMGQDAVVRKLLGTVTNGFYIECGALDGILSSNTFVFEKEYGWQGLLLEPDPSNLKKLYAYHRNAWISHSCLSTTPFPQEVIFKPNFDLGRISEVVDPDSDSEKKSGGEEKEPFNVQCFPLYSYLVALNVTTIDYFSLDIEGDELKVLKTIPFDKVLIKVISVEFLTSEEGEGPLREFMESKDYITVNKFYHAGTPFDLIFVHKSVNVPTEVLKELAVGM